MPSLFDFINDMVKPRRPSEDEEQALATPISLLNWPDLGIPAVTVGAGSDKRAGTDEEQKRPSATSVATQPAGDVLTGASGSATPVGGSGGDALKVSTADEPEEGRQRALSDGAVHELAKDWLAVILEGDSKRLEGTRNAYSGYSKDEQRRIGEEMERLGLEAFTKTGSGQPAALSTGQSPDATSSHSDRRTPGSVTLDIPVWQYRPDEVTPAVLAPLYQSDWKGGKQGQAIADAVNAMRWESPQRALELEREAMKRHLEQMRPDNVTAGAEGRFDVDGKRTIAVNGAAPSKGRALPFGSVEDTAVFDLTDEKTKDKVLDAFRNIAVKPDEERTPEDVKMAVLYAYKLERLLETDKKAFEALPPELQNYFFDFKRTIGELRGQPFITGELAPKRGLVELPANTWHAMTAAAANAALTHAVQSNGIKMMIRGALKEPADIIEAANAIRRSRDFKQTLDNYRKGVDSTFKVPPAYLDDPGLRGDEALGPWITGGVGSLAVKGGKAAVKFGAKKVLKWFGPPK